MKMNQLTSVLAILTLFGGANAHMALSWPLPLRGAHNPFATNIDYSITSPLNADGSNFPCKGYQSDLGSPAGTSVVTWDAGSQYNFTVDGGAVHGGGSCQAALSYDKGVSWTVIHSYEGSCPLSSGQNFDFTIPSDAKAGSDVLFAWLWYNEVGNREIYMSCAAVSITASSSAVPSTAFTNRPSLFVANLGNGCTTVEGKEVQFPDPGPSADVTVKYSVASDSGSFTGTCAAVKGIGGQTGSLSSSSSNSSTPAASGGASSAAPAVISTGTPTTMATSASSILSLSNPSPTSLSPEAFSTGSVSASSTALASSVIASSETSGTPVPASTGTGSGSLAVSVDGECSGAYTCQGSPHGPCCSQWGWCGSTDAYCGTGCMAGFGQCGTSSNLTLSSIATPSSGSAKFRIRS